MQSKPPGAASSDSAHTVGFLYLRRLPQGANACESSPEREASSVPLPGLAQVPRKRHIRRRLLPFRNGSLAEASVLVYARGVLRVRITRKRLPRQAGGAFHHAVKGFEGRGILAFLLFCCSIYQTRTGSDYSSTVRNRFCLHLTLCCSS